MEVVFDLGQAAMLDSSGIGLLIAAYNTVSRRQGRLHVVNVSGDVFQLLQTMRLVSRLNVVGRTIP
jgi:anti-anti-sigma factor